MADLVGEESLSVARVSRFLSGEELDVIPDIAEPDAMYDYAPELYSAAGKSALRSIRLALLAAELETVTSILDFACGGGRVLRFLKAAFPEADLIACDSDVRSIEFCSATFGATPILSSQDPEAIDLKGPFDLIWCGSLFSHLNSERFSSFLRLFESVLSPGGLAVFTVYGRHVVEELRGGEKRLSMSVEQVREVLRDYERSGFGFADTWDGNGDAIVSRAWACKRLDEISGLRLLLYLERSWLNQDVIACSRVESAERMQLPAVEEAVYRAMS